MKKLIAMILLSLLICPSVFAQETEQSSTEQTPAVLSLSLTQAIDMALTENPQITAADIKIKSCEVAISAAQEARAKYRSAYGTVMFLNSDYAVTAAKENLALAKKSKEQIKNKIAYDVTQKYYGYKLAGRLLAVAEESLLLAQENMSVVEKNHELGLLSSLEKDNASLSVNSCIATKDTYMRNLETAKEALLIALNADSSAELNLTDDIEYEDFTSEPFADSAAAIESRYDMNALKSSAFLASENFRIIKSYNSNNTANYHNAYSGHIQAEYTYENTKDMMVLNIKSLYNNILSSKDALSIAQATYDIHSRNYSAGKLRFEMGTISNIALTELHTKLSSSATELENAKMNYKLAVEKYKYEISTGL